jgi:hypothetical protein
MVLHKDLERQGLPGNGGELPARWGRAGMPSCQSFPGTFGIPSLSWSSLSKKYYPPLAVTQTLYYHHLPFCYFGVQLTHNLQD